MQLPTDYQAKTTALNNKVILITGAGDGIGRQAALTFAAHGATIILVGRTLAKLEKVYDEIEAKGGPQPALMPLNLESAQEEDYIAIANAVQETFGHLDGLLHNAGELGERTPISNYSMGAWMRCIQVNANAPFLLTKTLLPMLEASDSASVLFTSSSVAFKGRAYWGAYAASKAAQENLMETLADEYEGINRIRFNSINPGGTRSKMRKKAYPAEDPSTIKSPQELMPYYLFLMSDESRGISGHAFNYPK